MRITKPGKDMSPPRNLKSWYIANPITCPNCACQFQLGKDDPVNKTYQRSGEGPVEIYVACPNNTCGKCINVSLPWQGTMLTGSKIAYEGMCLASG